MVSNSKDLNPINLNNINNLYNDNEKNSIPNNLDLLNQKIIENDKKENIDNIINSDNLNQILSSNIEKKEKLIQDSTSISSTLEIEATVFLEFQIFLY